MDRLQGGREAMTLQREQIDMLLQDLEATAWRRHRADPADPGLPRDIVDRARAMLRVSATDEHLRICDRAQQLLSRLDGVDEFGGEHERADDGILRAVQPTREHVPDLGIALVDDPFDLDAYVPREATDTGVRRMPAPEPVHVLSPPTPPTPLPQSPLATDRRVAEAGTGDRELRSGLTPQQLQTLDTMSHFGWTLRFVRRPLFQPPVPVAFDRNRERFVVVEADGRIDDAPGLQLRD
jgi:hypothetical protein